MGHSINGMRELSGSNSCHHHDVDRQKLLELRGLNARENLALEPGDERCPEEATGGKVCRQKAAQYSQGTARILDHQSSSFVRGHQSRRLGSKPYLKGPGV